MELKQPKIRDKKHLRFVASLGCVACNTVGMTQAAHIRSGNQAGMSLKSGDDCTVPLCVRCHQIQHQGERKFWQRFGGIEKATRLAKRLYEHTGNPDMAQIYISEFRSVYLEII